MVVGDADQSIYAFRGANIRNILDFEQDFPNATSILLEQNYRSTQTILTAANSVIGHNKGRKEKRLWSDAGDGERIVGYVADDERDEARFVSEEIDKLTDDGRHPPRRRRGLLPDQRAVAGVRGGVHPRSAMPYKVVGGVRFYERREVRDALAYLRMLVNPADQVSLRRILNTPKRGIGDRAVECVQALADRERITFWEALRRAEEAPGPRHPLADRDPGLRGDGRGAAVDGRRRESGPTSSSRRVLARSGYLAELEELRRPAGRDPASRTSPSWSRSPASSPTTRSGRAVGRPRRRRRRHRRARASPTSWSGSRWWPTPTRSPTTPEDDAGVVTLMTLHTAKGLEFPVVFLTGLEDGVFPHARSLGDQPELEEERRLAYVGVTRARERLYISRAVVRSAWGAPSHNPARGSSTSCRSTSSTGGAPRPRRPAGAAPTWPAGSPRRGWATPTAAGRRNFSSAAARADAAARAKPAREIPSLEPGDRVAARLVRPGHRRRARGRRREGRRLDRLRLRGRQAAAAALRAGGEALVAEVEPSGRDAVGRPAPRTGRPGRRAPGRTSRCRCGPVTLPVEPT